MPCRCSAGRSAAATRSSSSTSRMCISEVSGSGAVRSGQIECYRTETSSDPQGAGLCCPIRPSVPPCPEAADDRCDPADDPDAGRREALRRAARAPRHQPRGRRRPGRGRARPVRVRQVHAVPRRSTGWSRSTAAPSRSTASRLPAEGKALAAPARRRRHGVPVLQPVRPQDDPRQRHARPAQGAQGDQGRGPERGRWSCWSGSGIAEPARQVPGRSSPAASSSGRRSPARWP